MYRDTFQKCRGQGSIRLSRKWTFPKGPLFQKTPLSEPDSLHHTKILVHHNAATHNAAMHNASFSQRYPYPFFTASSLWCPSLFFSIARRNFLHRTHRLSAFASNFPFATMVYCTKQQEIDQESQRSDVATGNARWPTQTQTQTQRCGALRLRCWHARERQLALIWRKRRYL